MLIIKSKQVLKLNLFLIQTLLKVLSYFWFLKLFLFYNELKLLYKDNCYQITLSLKTSLYKNVT